METKLRTRPAPVLGMFVLGVAMAALSTGASNFLSDAIIPELGAWVPRQTVSPDYDGLGPAMMLVGTQIDTTVTAALFNGLTAVVILPLLYAVLVHKRRQLRITPVLVLLLGSLTLYTLAEVGWGYGAWAIALVSLAISGLPAAAGLVAVLLIYRSELRHFPPRA